MGFLNNLKEKTSNIGSKLNPFSSKDDNETPDDKDENNNQMSTESDEVDLVEDEDATVNRVFGGTAKAKSKEEQKEDEKEQSKFLASNERSVKGGWLGDRDARTKRAVRTFALTTLAIAMIIIGSAWTVYGTMSYNRHVASTTTPFGVKMEFLQSKVEVELLDVWQDTPKDPADTTTIVRIGYGQEANKLLSISGEYYNINYMLKKADDLPENFESYFMRFGTDGDGLLILKGDLKDKAIQIFIENLVSTVNTGQGTEQTLEITDEKTISSQLSNYRSQDLQDDGQLEKEDESGITLDIINFRINPHSDSTRIFEGTFMNPDGSIDFDTIVRATVIDSLNASYRRAIQSSRDQIDNLEDQRTEQLRRLNVNPDDTGAVAQLENVEQAIYDQQERIERHIEQIRQLENTTFTAEDFGSVQHEYNAFLNPY